MPRSRTSELPQRPAGRGPHPVRTSSSDSSDSVHHRSATATDPSPRLGNRRSLRSTNSNSVNQKKLGTRIANLESQLGQAQEELKTLKDQLVCVDAAKRKAQKGEVEKKTSGATILDSEEVKENHPPIEIQNVKMVDSGDVAADDDVSGNNQKEHDVCEVQVEKETVDVTVETGHPTDQEDKLCTIQILTTEPVVNVESEKLLLNELALKNDEINMFKAKLEEKENKLEEMNKENQNLKNLLYEASSNMSSAKEKEEEMSVNLSKLKDELIESEANAIQSKEKLEALKGAKEELEAEIRKMRVQTEQWKKAADAAAAVLAGAVETNGTIVERCGSMEKQFGGIFETPATRYSTAFVGSYGIADDSDDVFGNGRRKGSGIKKLGELWRKKSQK